MLDQPDNKSPVESLVERSDYFDMKANRDLPLLSITRAENNSGPIGIDNGRTELTQAAN